MDKQVMLENLSLFGLDNLIREAKTTQDVFGPDLDKGYRQLCKVCHPDRNPGDKLAEMLFKRLGDLYNEAKAPPIVVPAGKRYTLHRRLATGDVSDVFVASRTDAIDKPDDYIFKISRIPHGISLLEREASVLRALAQKAAEKPWRKTWHKFVPAFVESLRINDVINKQANIFRRESGLISAENIKQLYPNGIDGRHIGWMFKRLLSILGFIHRHNIIHGATTPAHLLYHAENHGLVLVGWIHSVDFGADATITTISTKYRDWYPPEVLQKRPASASTDIYMAAKCMVYLAGGDAANGVMPDTIPGRMRAFIRSCLLPGQGMRPDDAWRLHDEFSELLSSLYGEPKYHHLAVK